MNKAFYLRLALNNLRRSRDVFMPQLIANAVIGGVYFLINGLVYSDGLNAIPSGEISTLVFTMGSVLFTIFAFFFMLYINTFLVKRRKKEFGLYAVLGLNKAQIGRVLFYENLITTLMGLAVGMVFALVFGNLLFLLLLNLIGAVGEATFLMPPVAYIMTLLLFFAIFTVTTVYTFISVRLANPIELLSSENKGDKKVRLLIPKALFGLVLLGVAYYFAWTISNEAIAIGMFFPLVLLVIIATYYLFLAGSVALLNALKRNKHYYYDARHFTTVSGLIHRMRQNARGLASICVLSTMLIVTLATTVSMYLGREEMLHAVRAYDIQVTEYLNDGQEPKALEIILQAAQENGVKIVTDENKGVTPSVVSREGGVIVSTNGEYNNVWLYYLDVEASQEKGLRFISDLFGRLARLEITYNMNDIFTLRMEQNGLYGGLLFLGAFFGVLFMCVTVLIIYFKQITEGHEDKVRFDIMQKVGMEQAQVKKTINAQVLIVFFVPLAMTLLHSVFATRIVTNMLQGFHLGNWGLVLSCFGVVSVLFIALYFVVFRMTARKYYKIVRRV